MWSSLSSASLSSWDEWDVLENYILQNNILLVKTTFCQTNTCLYSTLVGLKETLCFRKWLLWSHTVAKQETKLHRSASHDWDLRSHTTIWSSYLFREEGNIVTSWRIITYSTALRGGWHRERERVKKRGVQYCWLRREPAIEIWVCSIHGL